MTMLSPNFSLAELTRSDTAARAGLVNIPDAGGIALLKLVCAEILEPVRAHFGRPVRVNSGYRSRALNRLIPGSSQTSEHTLCKAVDFEIAGLSNYEVAFAIAAGDILPKGWGQLILEAYTPGVPSSGWVHTSLRTAAHVNEVLTMRRVPGPNGTVTQYLKGLHR